jgi:hypothetical protein
MEGLSLSCLIGGSDKLIECIPGGDLLNNIVGADNLDVYRSI